MFFELALFRVTTVWQNINLIGTAELVFQGELEVTFLCADGQQLSSQWILGHSEFFRDKMAKMSEFGNALRFDYTDYSWASVKLFLDCLHLIPTGSVSIATLAEVVAFCQFEGKTTYDSFEVDLVEGIMTSIMKTKLPLGTELLISAYFARVDNLDDRYQLSVAKKMTKDEVSSLFYGFDINNELNKRLIAMCVKKGIFADDSHNTVLITLMMYGKELQEFQVGNRTKSFKSGIRSVR